jgi:hypothetical protein
MRIAIAPVTIPRPPTIIAPMKNGFTVFAVSV